MAVDDPGSAREEAERLVATVLAAARLATAGRGGAGHGGWGPVGAGSVGSLLAGVLGRFGATAEGARFATGSAECCVCPICRAVAAMRDPSPEFAERLATGAGDLAAGVASMLRAFGSADADRGDADADADADAGRAAAADTGRAAGPLVADGDPGREGRAVPVPAQGQPEATAGRPARIDGDAVWRAATGAGHDSPTPGRDVWAAATAAGTATPPGDASGSASASGVGPTGDPRPAGG